MKQLDLKGKDYDFIKKVVAFRGHPFWHSCSLGVAINIARNAALLLANAVLRYGVRRSRRPTLQATRNTFNI
ncbi:hypothetical protein [Sporosarcina thermotolerans]|uniref:hypothetical protein n=1 Tax=Sporosarcina thermotolerans TaxID=633404 RepID=UPI0036D2D952